MSGDNHIGQDQLALFAMQLLDPDEAEEVMVHVSSCGTCRRALAEMQGDLAVYALTAEVHSPPALARERLLTQLRQEPRRAAPPSRLQERTRSGTGRHAAEKPGSGHRLPKRSRLGAMGRSAEALLDRRRQTHRVARLLPWGGWLAAAGLALIAGHLLRQRDTLRAAMAEEVIKAQRLVSDASSARQVLETLTDPNAMHVTLLRSKAAPVPVGRVSYLPQKGALVFLVSDLAPLGPYKTYELWLLPADGRDPMQAGTFVPDTEGNASVFLPPLRPAVPAKAFGVTIEDGEGSQTPTMPIVMAGR